MIKTDHQSLKYLLEQKIGTLTQHKWITKLLGYNFKIQFKQGVTNKVADSLSRQQDLSENLCCLQVSEPIPTTFLEFKRGYKEDIVLLNLITKV